MMIMLSLHKSTIKVMIVALLWTPLSKSITIKTLSIQLSCIDCSICSSVPFYFRWLTVHSGTLWFFLCKLVLQILKWADLSNQTSVLNEPKNTLYNRPWVINRAIPIQTPVLLHPFTRAWYCCSMCKISHFQVWRSTLPNKIARFQRTQWIPGQYVSVSISCHGWAYENKSSRLCCGCRIAFQPKN